MARWWLVALCVSVALAVLFESVPLLLTDVASRSNAVDKRGRFLNDYRRKMPPDYDFVAPVLEESEKIYAEGVFWPAMQRVYRENSIVLTVKSVSRWLANNYLARLLSPESAWEKLTTLFILSGVLVALAWSGVAIYIERTRQSTLRDINTQKLRAAESGAGAFDKVLLANSKIKKLMGN